MADGATIDSVIERARTFRDRGVTVSALSGGHINSAFQVRAGENRYVVRIPSPSDELRVLSRAEERQNTVAASRSGASPPVLEYLDDLGVMILDFVDGETLTDDTIGDPDRIPRIAAALKKTRMSKRSPRPKASAIGWTESESRPVHSPPVQCGDGAHVSARDDRGRRLGRLGFDPPPNFVA